MSGAHPLWPDYIPPQQQHSTTMARASSSGPSSTTSPFRTTISLSGTDQTTAAAAAAAASPSRTPLLTATSAASTSSLSSSSSFRRMVNNLRSTPSSPSSSSFHHASSSSSSSITARNASLDLPERRSMRKSLDRTRLQAAASAASAAAFLGFPSSTQDAPLPTSASSLAYNPTSRDFEAALADTSSNDRAPSNRQHALHYTPSRAQEPLPTSSSSSSFPRNSSRKSPSHSTAIPLATTFSPSSSSSSFQRLDPSAAAATNTSSFDAASSTQLPSSSSSSSSNMRPSTASLAPVPPSPAFSTHRNPNFSRLRSGSVSSYAASRTSIASDAQVSLGVHIWWPSTTKASSSTLARAPLFRDAANVKQKLSKRPASSQTRAAEPGLDAMFGFRQQGPSWLREKPSKGRLNAPTASIGPQGQWKRATLLIRDSGSLSILDEANALSHSVDCGALSASDVRFVHDSLFARPYVLMIQPRQMLARTQVSITTRKQEAALLQERARSSEPIFIEFKSEQEVQYVRTLLHIYAKPEIFGSPTTIDTGGSHRFFRQLDITISDAKSIMPKWPADLADSASDSSATPSMSPRPTPPMPPPPLPASPTNTNAFGGAAGSGDLPRSLSQQLASLRSEHQDDSPGSEPLTDDTLSGSSRASSRPSSRQRHNHPSTSSMRAKRELDEASLSRSASRPTSHYGASLPKGIDAASSSSVLISGPLSGDSGASRFDRDPAPSLDETAPSTHSSVVGGSGRDATSRAAAMRREDKDRFEKARFERYCRIRLDGELVARTSLAHSSGNAFAVDKFQLKDVGDVKSLFIEVLHPTLRTSSALSGTPAHSSTKFMMLGIVEIPIETLRRNEEIEGRFPIWSISTFSHLSQPTAANEDDGKTPTAFHRGVVGELSLSIRLHEGAVLPLTMYEEVYNRIHDEDAHRVLRHLFTFIRDDIVVSHVIRICAASGTITSRIMSLIEEESVHWGDKLEPELLFRANTPLSRSVDHFQRLLALSWLEACLGPTVRKICNDAQPRSDAGPSSSSSSAGSASAGGGGGGGGGGDDGPFDFTTSIRAAPTLPANAIDAIPDGPMTANSLRKLSETMWQTIYSQRHSCPPDLRTVLYRVRSKVNECYRGSKSTRPGIQGVGAFVFLRLFCAALNAPQLYGLTPSQPGRDAQRKLLLLSKVLLALASKKNAFDREKDWELVPLNDFLRTYSSAYDDYISVVSTEPPTDTPVQLLGMRIEGDADLQAAAQRRLGSLCTLHREAIPRAPYMLDKPQALASFVALVADANEERELAGVTQQPISMTDASSTVGSAQTEAARIKKKADEFIAICCRIEEAAGMCIELAGYDPRPIPFERLQRAAMSSLPRYGRGSADAALGSSPSRTAQGDAAMPLSARDASLGSSPARSRNRRATVGAALALPKLAAAKEFHPDGFSERHGPVPVSPREAREARRKSVGTPRSNHRRVSQVVPESPEYRVTAGADPLARRESEGSKTSNVQHVTAQPLGTSGAFQVASPSAYRTRFSGLIEDDDDHGSDVELREAYRKLRAEEAAGLAASRDAAAAGLPGISTAEGPLPRSAAGDERAQPSKTPEALDALMEAEDGSTFVPVYAPRSLPRTVGSRASFSSRPVRVRSQAPGLPGAPEPSRRHSSEEPEAPRNFSLPRPTADRNSAAMQEREESSDGFEMAVEDAYAQTRATLPPSASMPVNMAGLAPGLDGRYGKDFGGGTDGAGKKKKWWKP